MNFIEALQAALALKGTLDNANADLSGKPTGATTDSGPIAINTKIRIKGGGTFWLTQIKGEKR